MQPLIQMFSEMFFIVLSFSLGSIYSEHIKDIFRSLLNSPSNLPNVVDGMRNSGSLLVFIALFVMLVLVLLLNMWQYARNHWGERTKNGEGNKRPIEPFQSVL